MANIVERLTSFVQGDLARVDLTYDDALLLVVNIAATNDAPNGTLVFTLTSPRSFTRTIPPGGSVAVQLVGPARVPVTVENDYHGNPRFWGLIWSATFGV